MRRCVDVWVRGWVCAWSIDVCHGLLMYAYTCVDGWSSGYTCKGIMSGWVLGCVDAWMGGCVGGWARGCLDAMIARVRGRVGAWIGYCVWLSGA